MNSCRNWKKYVPWRMELVSATAGTTGKLPLTMENRREGDRGFARMRRGYFHADMEFNTRVVRVKNSSLPSSCSLSDQSDERPRGMKRHILRPDSPIRYFERLCKGLGRVEREVVRGQRSIEKIAQVFGQILGLSWYNRFYRYQYREKSYLRTQRAI